MAEQQHSLSSLLSALLETFRGAAQTEQEKQQMLMAAVMQVLFGNWTPFDQTRAPVVAYLSTALQGDLSRARREQYAASIANNAYNYLMENADINLELAVSCIETSDPMGFTRSMLLKHLPVILEGYVEFVPTPEQSFSQALRHAVVQFVGEWFHGLGSMMQQGPAGLFPVLMKLISTATASLGQSHPEHGPMLAASGPMVLNWLMGLSQQYQPAG